MTRNGRKVHENEMFKVFFAVLQVILTTIAGLATSEIRHMSSSITDLNVKVAVILTDTTNQKSEFQKLEKKVNDIEDKLRFRNGH